MTQSFRLSPTRERAAFVIVAVFAVYVCTTATEYYFRAAGVQRHHLETAWMWFVVAAFVAALASQSSGDADCLATPRIMPGYVWVAFPVLAIVLYYPAVHIGFLSDDFSLAELTARNQFFGQSWAFLRPLPLLWFKMVGSHPVVAHLCLLILHGLNAALVVRLARVVNFSRVAAYAAGALFVTFPADAEAVIWCAGIQDVLMTTAVLVGVIAATTWTMASSLAAVAVGLLCKETAVAAPVLIWLSNRTRWRQAAAAFIVAGAYAVWRIATKPLTEGYVQSPSSYKLKELLVRPFATLAVPFHGAQISQWPLLGTLLVCGLVLILARAAWLWRGNRQKVLLALSLAGWVLVSVAPVYSMFDVSATLQGSRYVYLATVGWSMLLSAWLLPTETRGAFAVVAVVCVIGVVGIRMNLAPWVRAAEMRDQVLSAVDRARADGCTAVWIRNVPDSVRGAYVFRNGLPEAARMPITAAAQPNCWLSVLFTDPR